MKQRMAFEDTVPGPLDSGGAATCYDGPQAPHPWTLVTAVLAVAVLGIIMWCAYDAFGLHGFQLRLAVMRSMPTLHLQAEPGTAKHPSGDLARSAEVIDVPSPAVGGSADLVAAVRHPSP